MGNWKLTRTQEPQALTEPVLREMRKGKTGGLTRRQLIRRSIGAAVALWLLEVGAGTLGFLWPNLARGFGGTDQPGRLRDRVREPGRCRPHPHPGCASYFPTARPSSSSTTPTSGSRTVTSSRRRGRRHERDHDVPEVPAPGLQAQLLRVQLLVRVPLPRFALRPPGHQGPGAGPGPARHGPLRPHRVQDGKLIVDTSKVVLGPLPVALGQPGLIPAKSPTGCI